MSSMSCVCDRSDACRFSVVEHGAISGLFVPLPTSNASFMALAEIVENLVSLDDIGPEPGQVRSAATRQVLAELRMTADWGEVELPLIPSNVNAWDATLSWLAGLPSTAL